MADNGLHVFIERAPARWQCHLLRDLGFRLGLGEGNERTLIFVVSASALVTCTFLTPTLSSHHSTKPRDLLFVKLSTDNRHHHRGYSV